MGIVIACRVSKAMHRHIRADILEEPSVTFPVAPGVLAHAHFTRNRMHNNRSEMIDGRNPENLTQESHKRRAIESRRKDRTRLVSRLRNTDPIRLQWTIPNSTFQPSSRVVASRRKHGLPMAHELGAR